MSTSISSCFESRVVITLISKLGSMCHRPSFFILLSYLNSQMKKSFFIACMLPCAACHMHFRASACTHLYSRASACVCMYPIDDNWVQPGIQSFRIFFGLFWAKTVQKCPEIAFFANFSRLNYLNHLIFCMALENK